MAPLVWPYQFLRGKHDGVAGLLSRTASTQALVRLLISSRAGPVKQLNTILMAAAVF